MKPYELTIAQAMGKMDAGDLTAVELTRSCLARIKEVDSRLQAFISVDSEGALSQALEADKKRSEGTGGVLCGVPLSIKDLLVCGMIAILFNISLFNHQYTANY